jgi:hypothetical protein
MGLVSDKLSKRGLEAKDDAKFLTVSRQLKISSVPEARVCFYIPRLNFFERIINHGLPQVGDIVWEWSPGLRVPHSHATDGLDGTSPRTAVAPFAPDGWGILRPGRMGHPTPGHGLGVSATRTV